MQRNKAGFEDDQRERFLAVFLPLPYPWHEAMLPAATQKVTRALSRYQTYEEYVDELLRVCCLIIDEEFTKDYCESILEKWREEISAQIDSEAEKLERKDLESTMPPSIIKSESKFLKPKLARWIRAYEVLRSLHSFQVFPEVGVRPRRIIVPADANYGFLPISFSNLLTEFYRKAKHQPSETRIIALNRTLHNEAGEYVVDNFIRFEIPTHENDSVKSIEVDLSTYIRLCALETIQDLIVIEAGEKYGVPGEVVARNLLGWRSLDDEETTGLTVKRLRGRPTNDFVNRLILDMDARKISKSKIRLLVDALTARKKRIDPVKSGEATWDVKRQTYRRRANVNAEKSTAKQIRELGGNLLRYMADHTVKKQRQCEKCDWRWNPKGELIRAIPCAKHKGLQDESAVDGMPKRTIDELTSHRGRAHFANALTEFVEERENS